MARKAEWIFRLLGRRGAPALAPAPDGRPTELLLGEQAQVLFESLPADDRDRLGKVGEAIAQLTRRAVALRTREGEIGAALADVGGPGHPAREAVREELERERHAVALALSEALAALDTIRLDLLRLRAGTATPEGLTGALDVVRNVGIEVDARLAALRELS